MEITIQISFAELSASCDPLRFNLGLFGRSQNPGWETTHETGLNYRLYLFICLKKLIKQLFFCQMTNWLVRLIVEGLAQTCIDTFFVKTITFKAIKGRNHTYREAVNINYINFYIHEDKQIILRRWHRQILSMNASSSSNTNFHY